MGGTAGALPPDGLQRPTAEGEARVGGQGVPGQLDQVAQGGCKATALHRAGGPELKSQVLAQGMLQQLGGGVRTVVGGGGKYTLPARAGHALVPMPTDKFRQARGDDRPHGGTRQGDKGGHGAGLVFMTVEDGELDGLRRGRGGTPMSGGSLTGA